MTTLPDSVALPAAAAQNAAALAEAAEAAAAVLPATAPLTPGQPQPGTPGSATGFAGAAVAEFDGIVPGAVAVLVGPELVAALESSPLGSLDLGAAAQPALDATWNAVNIAPDQPRTHRVLAAIAEDLGMDDLARRSRRAAAELDPGLAVEDNVHVLPPEARRVRRRWVDADADDPAWRGKLYGRGLFRGALGRSVLLGVAVVFAVPALLGSEMDSTVRLCFAAVAVAAWVGWFTVLRRHRRPE